MNVKQFRLLLNIQKFRQDNQQEVETFLFVFKIEGKEIEVPT
jgi:hypothetical protein